MSRFTQINTKKERKATEKLRLKVQQKRLEVRTESLRNYLYGAFEKKTKIKRYRRYRKQKDVLLRSWERYDSGQDPQSIILKETKPFFDIVLEIQENLIGGSMAIIIKRAHVRPGPNKSKLLYTRLTSLGQIVIFAPQSQKGKGKYIFGVSGIGRETIMELFDDMGINILESFRVIPEWAKQMQIAGVAKHDVVDYGEYLLS